MIGWLSLAVAGFMIVVNLPWHRPGCQIVVGMRERIVAVLRPSEHLDSTFVDDDVHFRVCGHVTRARALELFTLTHPDIP